MSDSHLTETEIKIHTPDPDAIRARLEAAGATLTAPRVHEHNVWYENDAETLRSQQIVLRLRKDSRVRLTYKAPVAANPGHAPDALAQRVRTRFEAEVEVSDFDTMDIILERLGFHAFVIYEKYRTTYTLDGTEIVLDEMPFGSFIEVEGTPPAIDAALDRLDLSDQPRILTNYMTLFEHVKAALDLDMHDLTFANFQAVHVPPDIFYGGSFIASAWGETE